MKINNKEIKVDPRKKIVTKTNFKGHIVFGNEEFIKKSGFSKEEFRFKNHNIIRHPDMPKIIFKMMWNNLKNNKNFVAIIKNKTKSGNYYWVNTDFYIELDHSNLPDYYTAYRRAVPKFAKKEISKLYKDLLEIEKNGTLADSENYLNNFLKEKNTTFEEYTLSLLNKKTFLEKLRFF